MQDIYDKYYWQNDKVRIRSVSPEDDTYTERFESDAWAMASEEITLPPVKKEIGTVEKQDGIELAFSVENLHGDYVGHVQFNEINERHGTFEIGVSMWRNHRNKGYAKEAIQILLKYAFEERRLNKCNVDCIDCNIASISLWKSLGFQQEGVVREAIFFNATYHNRVLFGLTANEYKLQHTL